MNPGDLNMRRLYINSLMDDIKSHKVMEDKRHKPGRLAAGFEEERPYFACLLLILLGKAALIVYVIANAGIGLGPDEAQYWTWSQQLAFGYYSKPPAIAWQIWGGTLLFGNTELGVRAGAVVMGSLLPIAVYGLGRAALLTRAASFWAAMLMAWSPLGMMAAFLAITDGGMVLLWTLAAVLVVRSLSWGDRSSYYALGACIACGALFKWLMYEFWIVVLILAAFLPQWRSWHLLGGVAVSLLGLLPSVVWNMENEWATFRHVGATVWSKDTVDVGTTGILKGNALEFIGAQAVLLSPVTFVLFILAALALWRKRREASPAILFCGLLSVGFGVVYSVIAIFKKMQGNWVDFAYPAAVVLVAWHAWDGSRRLRPWLVAGVVTSMMLSLFAFAIPTLQSESLLAVPYKFNPFRHNAGWRELPLELAAAGYNPEKHFLFADKYQTSSILSFYGPEQKRAYFLNLQQIRKNQFSYWPGLADEQVGETGFFVVVENLPLNSPKWESLEAEYKEKLAPYFRDVRYLGVRPIFYADGDPAKGAMLFKAVDYNGKEPDGPASY